MPSTTTSGNSSLNASPLAIGPLTPILKKIEISEMGQWITVPSLELLGKHIIVKGRCLKIALIHDEEWLDTELASPELYIERLKAAKAQGFSADIFTFAQKLPPAPPKFSYAVEMDSVAAIRLTSFDQWWEGLPQEARKNARRAQKRGVEVNVTPFGRELVEAISEVNNAAPMLQGVRNVHLGKSLVQIEKDYGSFSDRCDFLCATCDGETIGFLKVVYRGDAASILHITTKPSHYDKRPGNALITKLVEICGKKQVPYITYGMFNYGNKRDSPLREFKIRNGFQEVLVPRFYVPLTPRGRMCMSLGLHRGLIGVLPHWAITRALQFRAKWINVRQSSEGRCSSIAERPNCNRQMERSNPPAGSIPQIVDPAPSPAVMVAEERAPRKRRARASNRPTSTDHSALQ